MTTQPAPRQPVTRRQLAHLYQRRALLDREIAAAEAAIDLLREQYGRLPRERIDHGDESAYQRHIRRRVPFPEDVGGDPCGCRIAHAAYERRRQERAEEHRAGRQLTVYDALREA